MKNNSLAKKISSYSSLATVLAGMSNSSDAQIIYTDVYPEDTLHICGTLPLDLNNDGNADFHFVMGEHIFNYFYGAMVEQGSMVTVPNSLAGIATYSSTTNSQGSNSYLKLPFKLNYLDAIGPATPWVKPAALDLIHYCDIPFFEVWKQAALRLKSSSSFHGYWEQPDDGYLGMKINVGTESYYGWARLSVDDHGKWMVLKDYAFNTIGGEGLGAGEGMPVGIHNPQLLAITIAPNPASDNIRITLTQNSEQATLKMFNVEGKEEAFPVFKDINGWSADVNSLANGIYILEVKTSTHTYRNKVLITR